MELRSSSSAKTSERSISSSRSLSTSPSPSPPPTPTRTTDKEGDGSPEWNHELRLDVKRIPFTATTSSSESIFSTTAACSGTGTSVRCIPLRNFVEHVDDIVRVVSYQVKGPDGKPNGALTFCYKIDGVGEGSNCSIVQHHHRIEESIGSEKPPTGIIRHPTFGGFDYSVPALSSSYYPPPEAYYLPPPPRPPAATVYPAPPYPAVWPPSPAEHLHHHHYHHHHHSWSHFPYREDGGRWQPFEEGEGWERSVSVAKMKTMKWRH